VPAVPVSEIIIALALDPVVPAVPAPIRHDVDVPALPEVIAPAVVPEPAAPLIPVVLSPSVAMPDGFEPDADDSWRLEEMCQHETRTRPR